MKKVKVEISHENYAIFWCDGKREYIYKEGLTARDIRQIELAMMLVGNENVKDMKDAEKALSMLKNEQTTSIGLIVQVFKLFDYEDDNIIVEDVEKVRGILEHAGAREIFLVEEIL